MQRVPNLVGEWAYISNGGHVPPSIGATMLDELDRLELILDQDLSVDLDGEDRSVTGVIERLRIRSAPPSRSVLGCSGHDHQRHRIQA